MRQRIFLPAIVFIRKHWLPCLLTVLLLIGGTALGLYQWLLSDLPPVSAAAQRLISPTTQIVDRQGRVLYEVLDPDAGKQINLDLDALPSACIEATLATEDSRFYHHPGVDPIAIARAAWQNFRAGGGVVSGASTLTQQVARNLLLPVNERYEQSLRRKLREAWLAWRLEQHYSKDQVLALYLNQMYYGNFAFGIEAAAEIFFGKPAPQLSRAECALLAGLVQYPTGYNPLLDPDAAKARQLTVLRLMIQAGYLDTAERDLIAAEPLRYRSRLFDIKAPHFVMYVQDQVLQRVGAEAVRAGGLRVITTLDLDLQLEAESSLRYRLDLLNCRIPGLCDAKTDPNRRVDNAAAVILDANSGDILTMIGSPNYFDARIQGNVNAAVALRQPGSAIKPFTYAAALDPAWAESQGLAPLTAGTILPDLPATFYTRDEKGGNVPYQPLNYDRLFHGPVSVRTALASSYNIPAVRTLDYVGVDTLRQLATQAGISSFTDEYGLALTLGGGEVKLLDLATAFGVFKEGRRLDTRAILDIQRQDENGVWHSLLGKQAVEPGTHAESGRTTNSTQVISPEAAYLITDILSDPTARIPAFGEGSILELPFPAAVKTGTTTDWRDNWTIGYSTQRIVGVWVGNADNTPMLDVSGIDGAGPVWHDLMLAAHPSTPPDFIRPDDIVELPICAPSGLLPSRDCRRIRNERYIAGTEPTQEDNQFVPLIIDQATGLLASDETPSTRRSERVYWLLPPEYHDWMISQGIPLPPPSNTALAAASTNSIRATGPLILAAPTSNTAYQIHPGVPRDRQRIEVNGYVADGTPWAELRLIVDGEVLADAQDATRLRAWWQFTPGSHHFWLEGRRTSDSEIERTNPSLVLIETGAATTVTNMGN
ncbi:MAG: transglycosylase domain-containing protein [Caldilineaceae bacterium]|nr:transglycosylase domain-containing protein [Caldilineaceae bacterium]